MSITRSILSTIYNKPMEDNLLKRKKLQYEKIYKEILLITNIMYNINTNIIINRRIPSTIIIKISNKTIYLNNKI